MRGLCYLGTDPLCRDTPGIHISWLNQSTEIIYLSPMKLRLTFLILLLSVQSFFAQQPAHFFLGKDNLEGVQIYDVIQDNELNYCPATSTHSE